MSVESLLEATDIIHWLNPNRTVTVTQERHVDFSQEVFLLGQHLHKGPPQFWVPLLSPQPLAVATDPSLKLLLSPIKVSSIPDIFQHLLASTPTSASASTEEKKMSTEEETMSSEEKPKPSFSTSMIPASTSDQKACVAEYEAYHDTLLNFKASIENSDGTPFSEQFINYLLHQLRSLSQDVKLLKTKIYINFNVDERKVFIQALNAMSNGIESNCLTLEEFKGSSRATSRQIRLPEIRLPTFSGAYTEWVSFQDKFNSIIAVRNDISNSEKLDHLISCLSGDAAQVVKNIPITDDNYEVVYKLLESRFAHTREIVNSTLLKIINLPLLTSQSATGMNQILTTVDSSLRILQNFKIDVSSWDSIVNVLITSKLDTVTRRDFENTLLDDQLVPYSKLSTFLANRARALSIAPVKSNLNNNFNKASPSSSKGPPSTNTVNTNSNNNSTTNKPKSAPVCPLCKTPHLFIYCEKFKTMSIKERRDTLHSHQCCFNCFSTQHSVSECKKDPCKKCGKRHHRLLHVEASPPPTQTLHVGSSSASYPSPTSSSTLLATALVQVDEGVLRSIIDFGSHRHLLTERGAQMLNLQRQYCTLPIFGAGGIQVATAHGKAKLKIKSIHYRNFHLDIEVLIVPSITSDQPHRQLVHTNWPHIKGLPLADPHFDIPGKIDLLLGASIYSEIMLPQIISPPATTLAPSAQHSQLGWILIGQIPDEPTPYPITHFIAPTNESVLEDLSRLWTIEEPKISTLLSPEEQKCEDIFTSTHTRNEDGRYIVHLPFKDDHPPLGESRPQAIRRLYSIEKRLNAHPHLRLQYENFMDEYLSLHHMEVVPPEDLHNKLAYYLPHHFVLKDSSTTALRVVFDGSAKTTTTTSFNDILMVGPKVQEDLIPILLSFRFWKIGMSADVAKFYRQTLIHPPHANLQRIVWRKDKTQPPVDYRLLTNTYGTGSASHLSMRALKQLAIDEQQQYPAASLVVQKSFYSDNVLTGGHSVKSALLLQRELIQICQTGGMTLRKWISNSPTLVDSVPPEARDAALSLDFDDPVIKALGVIWDPTQDHFKFKVNPPPTDKTPTKRTILSHVARIFDPLNFLCPVTIVGKLLIQTLWSRKTDWDSQIDDDLLQMWQSYCSTLNSLENLQIPRFVNFFPGCEFEIHGFCDASEKSYSACTYIRIKTTTGSFSSHLLQAKSRVCPLKFTSIPRLELCGALLLSRLMDSTVKVLPEKPASIFFWTDSTICLHWLQSPASKWRVFVANRISEIQETSLPSQWFHVSTTENPADLPTRGMTPDQLIKSQLWWFGPSWLQSNQLPFGPIPGTQLDIKSLEIKSPPVVVHIIDADPINDWLYKFSSLSRLKRVTAYIHRFVHNTRNPKDKRTGPIAVSELHHALLFWIRATQHNIFIDDIRRLKQNLPLSKKSKLLSLSPYVDSQNILRVGGRLQNAKIPEAQKHPMLLPSRPNFFTILITRDCHQRLLHAGPTLMKAHLHQTYWILNCKGAVRQTYRSCITCTKHAAATQHQVMGQLPDPRVNSSIHPFFVCGVDLAGPINVLPIKGRGRAAVKMWIVIFVCFATKAVHLEHVQGLSKEAFLACLRRFISRRGICSEIWSDQGTNLVGTNNELIDLNLQIQELTVDPELLQELASHSIQWKFNPPASPHMGGLWEAAVKSVKFHLRRAATSALFNLEELLTLLCQIEACLNSRPLVSMSTDPSDFQVLTPGHFLIGQPLTAIPEPDLTTVKINHLNRWQLIQRQVQHFWQRWSKEYLHTLQSRSKWTTSQDNIQIDDLVVIKEDSLPVMKWKVGRVTQIHPGLDSKVRVVTIRIPHAKLPKKSNLSSSKDTATVTFSDLQRPIHKLIKLPIPTWTEDTST